MSKTNQPKSSSDKSNAKEYCTKHSLNHGTKYPSCRTEPKSEAKWDKDFDEIIDEAFFTILGDTRFIAKRVDYPREISQEELKKEELLDQFKIVIKKSLHGLLHNLLKQHDQQIIKEIETYRCDGSESDGISDGYNRCLNDVITHLKTYKHE